MGRKPKFASEKELEDACAVYFEQCIKTEEIPSKAGLRVELDIRKETYRDYKQRYPHPIKKAEDLIEKAWVKRLGGANATGAIFYLKNAFFEDYRDRHETDLTSGGEKITGINYIIPPNASNAKAND